MGWRPVTSSTETVSIHAALLPTGTQGQIICMGDWVGHRPVSTPFTYWQIYDIQNNEIVVNAEFDPDNPLPEGLTAPDTNAFCCGQAWLADGRWLCAGGTVGFSQEGHHAAAEHYDGERAVWIFQPQAGDWTRVADLNFQPNSSSIGGGRWYPTLVTLPDGQVFATAGHPNSDDDYLFRHNNNTPERYLPGSNTWKLMNFDITAPNNVDTDSYPRYHLMPDGWLFCDTAGNEGNKRFFDPKNGVWGGSDIDTSALPPYYNRGSAGTSVLLPLQPPNYQTRILAANSPTSRFYRIDTADSNPAWTTTAVRVGPAAEADRENGCAVILPTGEVLLVGGWPRSVDNNLTGAVRFPELYRSGINWSTGEYSEPEEWVLLDDPSEEASIPRGYHFTTILMPNGSIFTAGSTTREIESELGIEIYDPWYVGLSRPTLAGTPAVVKYNDSFTVQVNRSIERVAMLRCGSMTHGFDSDQRYVGLTFQQSGNTLEITSPPHGGIAPPGPYMLWVIDDDGRPCEQAEFIRLTYLECEIGLERNTFSVLEIEAKLLEPEDDLAIFKEAIYFHFDGFRAPELGIPGAEPDVDLFVGTSPGSAPSGMSLRLASVNFEGGTPSPDRAQRFTFRYDVRFADVSAFNFGGSDQNLTVRASLGGETCSAQLRLTKNPNPYMLDGDPHWLSKDLRVFQIRPGGYVGTTQFSEGDSPESFLEKLLSAFESEAETNEHPFRSELTAGQNASALELATTVDGEPVYNFAIAKVRYQAVSIPANDVRVMFRLFNTVGPALEWTSSVTYRREVKGANGRDTTALLGMTGGHQGEIISVPFYATPRFTPSQSAKDQEDPLNRRNLPASGSAESTAYFGCWLDINQTEHHFPYYPNGDGPYSEDPLAGGPLKSVFDSIRNYHQCLVAEIYYEDDPISFGDTPGKSDNLSQRNLVLETSSNPGNEASRTILSTMMIQPSKENNGHPLTAAFSRRQRADELIIWWETLPKGTEIDLYIPSIKADTMLELAGTRPNGNPPQKVDEHTIRASYGDVTFIPIPAGLNKPIPSLVSICLPAGVTAGDTHRAVIQQVAGRSRLILGGIEFRIPVHRAEDFVNDDIRKLAILRAMQTKIDESDRWWPVFERYVDGFAARVDGLGGDSATVKPQRNFPSPGSVNEEDNDENGRDKDKQRHLAYEGKVAELRYNCHGNFEGFVLKSCTQKHLFEVCESQMEALLREACSTRATLRVNVAKNKPHIPLSIVRLCC